MGINWGTHTFVTSTKYNPINVVDMFTQLNIAHGVTCVQGPKNTKW